MDLEQMTPEQLEAARAEAEAGLAEDKALLDRLLAADKSLRDFADKHPATDEASRSLARQGLDERYAEADSVARRIRVAGRRIAKIDKLVPKIVQYAIRPSPVPPKVESVLDDLGDATRAPIRPSGGKLPIPAAVAAAAVVVVILSTVGIIWRNDSQPAPAPKPSAVAKVSTAPTAATVSTPIPNPSVALHSEGFTVPAGAGCSHPGNLHFGWTVRDANPGDKLVVTLTGPGVPPSLELVMPADLKPVVEVPIPLNTSGRWTAHVASIAGKATNGSALWDASTGATCS